MDHKQFTPGTVKEAAQGKALVVIATLGVRDKDGDVTLPGYFGEQTAVIQGSHDWKMPSLGKAKVYERDNEALAELDFNLDSSGGKDWFGAIAFDLAHPPAKQQYSYGFTIRPGGSVRGEHNGQEVRFLKPLPDGSPGVVVHEVSPVLLGAGEGTRTLDAKGQRTFADEVTAALAVVTALKDRAGAIVALRAAEGRALGSERVAQLKALVDEVQGLYAQLQQVLTAPAPAADQDLLANLMAECEATRYQLSNMGLGLTP